MYSKQFSEIDKENILLYGADDAGEIALRWILRNPSLGYSLVGFLDEDSLKWGSNIHGVNVIGDISKLERFIEEKRIRGIIITSDISLHSTSGEKLVSTCREKGVWVRILRLEFELKE